MSAARLVSCRMIMNEPKPKNREDKMKIRKTILVTVAAIVFSPVIFIGLLLTAIQMTYLFGRGLTKEFWRLI